jgi:oligopeptide transport system permease protein
MLQNTLNSPSAPSEGSWRVQAVFNPLLLARISLGLILVLALLGDQLGLSPSAINPDDTLVRPFVSSAHWLGTDELGRDVLARLALGAKISLLIGVLSALLSVVLGTLYGATSALLGGWIDGVMMRVIDVLYSLPFLMVVILMALILGRFLAPLAVLPMFENVVGLMSLIAALAFFSWPDTARLIRGQVLKLREDEFIEAARSLGASLPELIFKHLVPNVSHLMILSAAMTIPRAILTEATLSFIGLGVNPPWCSWGTMIGDGWSMIRINPLLMLWPTVLLALTVLSLNTLAESYRLKQ